ncbi:hypothetical protein [Methanimicrococcus stummii]|uniref:hypothetical protein n=1 Tax=Methanimicrococcus stummii TaxID=3028294 RepID=UPI00292E1DDC|nr:hypothetical protein [Methanimicrococcus sp. Es2]
MNAAASVKKNEKTEIKRRFFIIFIIVCGLNVYLKDISNKMKKNEIEHITNKIKNEE